MNIVAISDFEFLNIDNASLIKATSIIEIEQFKALHDCVDTRTAKAIKYLAEGSTLTAKQDALLNGQYVEDEQFDMFKFNGVLNYIKAWVELKLIANPEFKNAKAVFFNSENSSGLSSKDAASSAYNSPSIDLKRNYCKFLEHHYSYEPSIASILESSGIYEIELNDVTFLDINDVIFVNSVAYKVESITDKTITITTSNIITTDMAVIYYPFNKFYKSIKLIV